MNKRYFANFRIIKVILSTMIVLSFSYSIAQVDAKSESPKKASNKKNKNKVINRESSSVNQKKYSVQEMSLLSDMKYSFEQADLYRAYKISLKIKDTNKEMFFEDSFDIYLQLISKILNVSEIVGECKKFNSGNTKFANRVNYICGRTLVRYEKFDEAKQFLNLTNASPKKNLLLASLDLVDKKSDDCLNRLNEYKLEDWSASNLEDLYLMTRARCDLNKNDLKSALVSLQNIKVGSPYYLSAIEKQLWVFFKLREKNSMQTLSKVLLSSYEESNSTALTNKNRLSIGPSSFFQIHYLLAYLDLVAIDGVDSSDKFTWIENEITKYKKTLPNIDVWIKNIDKELSSEDFNWIELQTKSSYTKDAIVYLENWLSKQSSKELVDLMQLKVSLRQELARFDRKVYKDLSKQKQNLQSLEHAVDKTLKLQLAQNFGMAFSLIENFSFKAKLGILDYNWAQITNGISTIDQALEVYAEKETMLDRYLGSTR